MARNQLLEGSGLERVRWDRIRRRRQTWSQTRSICGKALVRPLLSRSLAISANPSLLPGPAQPSQYQQPTAKPSGSTSTRKRARQVREGRPPGEMRGVKGNTRSMQYSTTVQGII